MQPSSGLWFHLKGLIDTVEVTYTSGYITFGVNVFMKLELHQYGFTQYLTLSAHAPQSYSSRVCVCVCVCVCVFQTVTNQPGRPTDRLSAAINWLKHGGIRKTVSSRRYRIRVAAVLPHLSAILLALAGARAYIHSRDVALDHVVLLLRALPLCLARTLYSARAYLYHWTLT